MNKYKYINIDKKINIKENLKLTNIIKIGNNIIKIDNNIIKKLFIKINI
jgi:hypothetical protein